MANGKEYARTDRQHRAALLTEWLQYFNYALAYGASAERAKERADVLVYGQVQGD